MREVEFVVPEPDQGEDEVLPERPRRAYPRLRRLRAPLFAAAVIAFVVIAFVVHARSNDSTPRAAYVTGTAPNLLAPEAPSGAFRVDHLGATDAPEGGRPGRLVGSPSPVSSSTDTPATVDGCPSSNYCTTTTALPATVMLTLLHAFPHGTLQVRVSSVLIHGAVPGSTLWMRTITAHSGKLTIRVNAHLAGPGDVARSGSSSTGAGSTVYATSLAHGLAVDVVVTGPQAQAPGVATVRTLAADRRLLAVAA